MSNVLIAVLSTALIVCCIVIVFFVQRPTSPSLISESCGHRFIRTLAGNAKTLQVQSRTLTNHKPEPTTEDKKEWSEYHKQFADYLKALSDIAVNAGNFGNLVRGDNTCDLDPMTQSVLKFVVSLTEAARGNPELPKIINEDRNASMDEIKVKMAEILMVNRA